MLTVYFEPLCGMRLVLGDLGDSASRARVLANAAGDAGILVGHGSGVLELQNALGAGVDANATSDALVGINYGMSHVSFLSVAPARTCDERRLVRSLKYHVRTRLQYPRPAIYIPFAEYAAAY